MLSSPHVISDRECVYGTHSRNNGTTMDAQNALTTTWVVGSVTPFTGLNTASWKRTHGSRTVRPSQHSRSIWRKFHLA
ncbi:hypothetical protein JB92DRAFT_3040819 [Gautieria morchelliformis]|nr:hypothetical protein JB92DRAFT_3040819 [Gautieria morchelliformis]